MFIPLTFYINYILSILFGSIAFFIKDKRDFGSLLEAIGKIKEILTGSLIELTLIPFIGYQMIYNPFALSFYHPTQVFLGKYSLAQTLTVIIATLVWIVFLYIITVLIFRYGLKKNESVGL
jgi:ABC-type uncharacterized transport system permease subunit